MRKIRRVKKSGPSGRQSSASRSPFTVDEMKSSSNVPAPTGGVAVPPPPAGAKWRIEQDVPGRGWQFDSYASTGQQRKERLASIRNFGGRPRAVELAFVSERAWNQSRPEDGFIGDAEGRPSGARKLPQGGEPCGQREGGRQRGAPTPSEREAQVGAPGRGHAGRLLQAQAAHWLRYANDAGCDVKLARQVLEQVLEASKRALHSRPRAFADAQNRAPRATS